MLPRAFILAIGIFCVHAKDPLTLGAFSDALREHISREKFAAATWGIKVVSLETGAVLFETNANKLLKPASNAKLYTAALALERFGPDDRVRTSIYSESSPDEDGVLNGDLVIYGRGDPSIAQRFTGTYSNLLGPIVAEIKRAGIRSIQGDLIGDETYFSGPRLGSGWSWDDLQYYYGAEVSALTFQDNVVDLVFRPATKIGEPALLELRPETDYLRFIERPRTAGTNAQARVGLTRELTAREVRASGVIPLIATSVVEAVAVPDPALWFTTMLRSELRREGISIAGLTRTRSWPGEKTDVSRFTELGAIESRPMRDLIEKMLKPSQNLYAQLLLLQVGAQEKTNRNMTTEEQGIGGLRRFLDKAGVDPDEVLLEEGSGLSRGCLVTPNATVALLKYMAQHEHAAVYERALPEPGEGTLRRRLSELKGRLRAKTGSLRYVNTLSGYLTTAVGERLAFSIMLNAYNPPGATSGRDDLDAVPRIIASLSEKSAAAQP